jgi:hypothetical protein
LFLFRTYLNNVITINILINNVLKIACAMIGVFALYITINYFTEIKKITIPVWVIHCNNLCMGVYILHEFIFLIIYHKTDLGLILGTYWLPVITLIITLSASALLTKFSLRYKIGKVLLG